MATTNKILLNGNYLTTSNAVLATVDTSTTFRITQATITNVTADPVSFNLYLCIDNSVVTDPSNKTVLINKVLDAYETYILYELSNHVLLSGYTIQGYANTSTSLAIRVSGIQFV